MHKKPIRKPRSKLNKKQKIRKFRKKSILRRQRMLFLKRFALVFGGLVFLFLVFFGAYLLLSKIFAVKSIEVMGSNIYSEQEIISAGELHNGESFLFLSSRNAENKIYKSLVNIDSVKISKKFPNKIKVDVEDAFPKYYIKEGEEYLVLSEKNKLLEKTSEPPTFLIGIIGFEFSILETGKIEYKNKDYEKLLHEILDSCKDKNLDEINSVDISDIQNITVNYDRRIKMNLGDKEDIDYKILTAKEILNNKISKFKKGTFNLKNLRSENRSYFTYE